jgi:hypothetical protein
MGASQQQQQSAAASSSRHFSLKQVAQRVVKAAKQHNREVQASFEAFYGVNYHPDPHSAKRLSQ